MMEMFKYLLVVLTLTVSWISVVQSLRCPYHYMKCLCSPKGIFCDNKGWTDLPSSTHDIHILPLETFDISNNNIRVIPGDRIPKGVHSLDLRGNPISDIDPAAFAGCETTLNAIFMSDVKFTKLPDAFLMLQNLTLLSLRDSAVDDWNPPVFNNFASTLHTLDLRHAGLKFWPSWFKNLTKLSTVSLAGEFIDTIPDDTFDALADTLASIHFSNLTHVPKALRSLRNLKEINLDFCSLQDLNGIPRTESLSLRHNGIGDDFDVFGALNDIADSLSDLYLKGNKLTLIPDFSKLSKLKLVDLDQNEISDATNGFFSNSVQEIRMNSNRLERTPKAVANKPNLKELYLSGNLITQIRAGDIPKSLLILNLSSNIIPELTPDSFPVDSEMTRLYLQHNPLSTISPTAFENLKRLERLDISDTSLFRIPLALAPLENLIEIRYMDNLSCSCPLPEPLMIWFAGVNNQTKLYGSCIGADMRTYLRGASCRRRAYTTDSGHQIVYNLGSVSVCLFIMLLIGR